MPTISRQTSMATGTTATPLSGDQFEFLENNAHVEIGIVADVASVSATVTVGSDLLQSDGPVQQKATPPLVTYPDDFMLTDDALAGSRIVVLLRNANAGTALVGTKVRITWVY